MRKFYASALGILICAISVAAPPKLTIAPEIKATGDYVIISPDTDALTVTYVGLSGVESFPSEMLKDGKTFLLPVRGLKDGKYNFVAIGIKDNEYTRTNFTVVIGATPIPKPIDPIVPIDPKPIDPVPPPDPKLDDAPVSTAGVYMAVVFETGSRVTQNQFNIMYGANVRKWADVNTTYRLIDKDQIPNTDPWKNAVARKRTTIPWLIVMSNKKYVYEGPLPDITEDDFIKSISKYNKQ